MLRLDRSNTWLALVANLAILVGLILVVLELNQNTEHIRLLLMDQITARMKENNRALLGENPTTAIEKSIHEPESMTYAEFRIVDAYLINVVGVWEDRFFLFEAGLAGASDWKQRIKEEVAFELGSRFAKNWWREGGRKFVEPEVAQFIDEALKAVGDDDTYNYWLRIRPPVSSPRK